MLLNPPTSIMPGIALDEDKKATEPDLAEAIKLLHDYAPNIEPSRVSLLCIKSDISPLVNRYRMPVNHMSNLGVSGTFMSSRWSGVKGNSKFSPNECPEPFGGEEEAFDHERFGWSWIQKGSRKITHYSFVNVCSESVKLIMEQANMEKAIIESERFHVPESSICAVCGKRIANQRYQHSMLLRYHW